MDTPMPGVLRCVPAYVAADHGRNRLSRIEHYPFAAIADSADLRRSHLPGTPAPRYLTACQSARVPKVSRMYAPHVFALLYGTKYFINSQDT